MTQQFIDNLIQTIYDAEIAGSISAEMVARLFDHLNSGYKNLLNKTESIDSAMSQQDVAISNIQKSISSILGGNTTDAIENLNEVLTFLQDFKDSDTLFRRLSTINEKITTLTPNLVGQFAEDTTEEDWYWFPNGVKTPIEVDPFTRKFSYYYPTPLTKRFAMFWIDGKPEMAEKLVSLESIPDISALTETRWMLANLSNITTCPAIDLSNSTDMQYMFQNCTSLVLLPRLNTAKVKYWGNAFNWCSALRRIDGLDFSSVESIGANTFNCASLAYLCIDNLGKSSITSFQFQKLTKWGTGGETNRKSLVDSLLNNSFNRAAAGLDPASITLSAASFAALTTEEVGAISLKGYTIVTA